MNLSQILQQSGVIESMARELNIDEQTARIGAGALLPAIVAGVGRTATQAAPASGGGGLGDLIGGLVSGGGAAGGLGGLGGILLDQVLNTNPTPTQPGNDILGQIFGSKDVSRGVAEEVSGSTGIPATILKQMLPILAMAVMGYLMNRGGDTQAQASDTATTQGGMGGALGGILTQVVTGMLRR